jgi:hypothetical protein
MSTAIPITVRVKSYEDACAIKGITPLTLEHFSYLPAEQQVGAFGKHKVETEVEVLNEGWVPDFDNGEWKWFPVFDMRKSAGGGTGFGFSSSGALYGYTFTSVGSRLLLKSEALSDHLGTVLINDCREMIKG